MIKTLLRSFTRDRDNPVSAFDAVVCSRCIAEVKDMLAKETKAQGDHVILLFDIFSVTLMVDGRSGATLWRNYLRLWVVPRVASCPKASWQV